MNTMLRITAVMSLLAARRAIAANTPSRNKAIPKPECDPTITVSIRHSSESAGLYLESADGNTRGGCVTLQAVWEKMSSGAPLYPVDSVTGNVSSTATGTWLLTESLYVEDGITLQVHGTTAGGDADELRLLSTSDTYIALSANGGSLDFLSTKVFAWDTSKNAPDTNEDDYRSYIKAVSEVITDSSLTCDGRARTEMGEARMDIERSEMGYLGFHGGESYGLTWKVKGYCTDLSNPEVFDDVNVYGNIYNSDIHHNHFGVYTYGHQQGDWRNNEMHDNTAYGFDPHDDSDFLTIHDNKVYNNGKHGIIASKRCNGVSIQGNEVYGGGEESVGIFLHRSTDNAVVKGNYVHGNGDAGMALMETFNADVTDNVFENNKYGVRLSVGCADNVFSKNVISDSTKYNVYTYDGMDSPWVVDSGRPQNNVFSDNTITGGDQSITLRVADGTEFIDNTFEGATALRFDDSTGTVMSGNTGVDDVERTISNGACFAEISDADFTPIC